MNVHGSLFITDVTGKIPGAGLNKLVDSFIALLLTHKQEQRTNPGSTWMDLKTTMLSAISLTRF